jgi:hypothetical protein
MKMEEMNNVQNPGLVVLVQEVSFLSTFKLLDIQGFLPLDVQARIIQVCVHLFFKPCSLE